MVTESIMELLYMMEEAAEGTEYVAGIEKVINILNDYEEYEWDSMRSSEKKYYVLRALKNEEPDYGEDLAGEHVAMVEETKQKINDSFITWYNGPQ